MSLLPNISKEENNEATETQTLPETEDFEGAIQDVDGNGFMSPNDVTEYGPIDNFVQLAGEYFVSRPEKVLMFGEYHEGRHDVPGDIIAETIKNMTENGERVVLAIEAMPQPHQDLIDRYSSGEIDKEQFLEDFTKASAEYLGLDPEGDLSDFLDPFGQRISDAVVIGVESGAHVVAIDDSQPGKYGSNEENRDFDMAEDIEILANSGVYDRVVFWGGSYHTSEDPSYTPIHLSYNIDNVNSTTSLLNESLGSDNVLSISAIPVDDDGKPILGYRFNPDDDDIKVPFDNWEVLIPASSGRNHFLSDKT
jgi:hypothetical protein